MRNRVRWVYLTTAPDQLTAEMWSELLRNEDVPAMVRGGGIASAHIGVSNAPCRIMVLESRLEEARRLLEEHLGPEALR